MRRIGIFVVAALVAGGLSVAVVSSASASVAAKSSRFCRDIAKLNTQSLGAPGSNPSDSGKLASGLRKASKHAPRKVKKALRTMAGVYQRIANGDSERSVVVEDGGKFSLAAQTFGAYFAKHCINITVPTTLG